MKNAINWQKIENLRKQIEDIEIDFNKNKTLSLFKRVSELKTKHKTKPSTKNYKLKPLLTQVRFLDAGETICTTI